MAKHLNGCLICHTYDKSELFDIHRDYRGLSVTPIYGADPSNISGRYTHIWGLPRQVKLFCSTDHNVQEPISKPIFYPFYSFMIGRSKQSMKESTYFGLGIQWNWSSRLNAKSSSKMVHTEAQMIFNTKDIATHGPSLSSKLIWSSSQLISSGQKRVKWVKPNLIFRSKPYQLWVHFCHTRAQLTIPDHHMIQLRSEDRVWPWSAIACSITD